MLITLSGRRIVEEKSDDDEIPNYITALNTVIAKQENYFHKNTISDFKSSFIYRSFHTLEVFNLINTLSQRGYPIKEVL